MVQAKPRFLSFDDYLAYTDETQTETAQVYELFNGELIAVPPESGANMQIASFLYAVLLPIVGYRKLRWHGLEIEVRGEPKNRYPDLTVIRDEHIPLLLRRNTIRLTMPPPLLVVEIVSPGDLQRERDYIAKRLQYQDVGIPEYWIVDPNRQIVTLLSLQNHQYQDSGIFQADQPLVSPTFPELLLTAAQIFTAGQGEPV